jgi:Chaperone of endosialidase
MYYKILILSKLLFATSFFLFLSIISTAQNSVSIGTPTINGNAVLWLNSPGKNQGLIIPIVSNKAAVLPVAGMIVFDDSDKKIYYHDGTNWVGPLGSATGGGVTYTAGTGINITGTAISNTGDTNASDDITTSSNSGGDVSGTFSNLQIATGTISDAEVATGANIAGTKINPNFGTQNITTTGSLNASAAIISGSLSVAGNLTSLRGVTYNWPTAQSLGARVLQNDGIGNLTWATVGGSGDLLSANNLSDVGNVTTSRTNLGLGSVATLSAITTTEITNGTILNADVSTSAAIAGTKINPAFGTQNISTTGTLSTGAATVSGLTIGTSIWPANATGVLTNNGTGTLSWAASAGLSSTLSSANIFVGNASNVATGIAMSGDATIANTGAVIIANSAVTSAKINDGTITNADVSTTAAIAGTKIIPSFGTQDISGSGKLTILSNTTGNIVSIQQGPSGHGLNIYASTVLATTSVFNANSDAGAFIVGGNGDVHVIGFANNARLGVNTSTPDANLSVSGTASKTGGGSWATFSDKRVKKDITEFKDGLALITKIKPVRFRYNGLGGNTDDGKDYVGVIAQDIQFVAPYMVNSVRKKLKDTDSADTELLMYDGSALTYILINAIKEQQLIIEKLSTHNEKQDQEIAILNKQMEEIKRSLGLEMKKEE